MKQLLFLILLLPLCAFQVSAQVVSNGPGTFVWTEDEPFHNPGASGAKFAVDRNTYIWYEWTGTTWTASGDRIQSISGCSAPAYIPGKNKSGVVINGCQEMYQYYGGSWRLLNPVSSVASVADSAAFRAYVGAADLLIMRDTARGGEFAKCVPCVADNYMVFTDGNGNRWRRINYDRILESWWGKWGHVSLQRAINYVAQKGSGTVGVLTHNQDITLKDSVLVWDGVQIHGISPSLVPGTHPLDAPAKNVIALDLNNANKGAIVWNDNGRGYSDATLIKNVGIVAVSPCRAALVVKKPNGGNISDILISGGGEVIADRKITNAIEVSATVYTNWNNINIIGAKTGIKETEAAFSGGTLTITGTSSVRRCVTGIDMAFGGTITATGLFMENIDTTGIICNTLFWSGAYTENVPMAANGTAVKTLSSDAVINIQNVKFNGGTNCISGDCAAFDGSARHVMLLNNDYYNINKIVRSPNAPSSGVLGGGTWYNVVTRTQNVYGNNKWTCGAIAQYSGGTPDTVASWYTGEHRFKILRDKDDATGNDGDVLQSNGDKTMSWGKLPLSSLSGDGVAEGQYIVYDGETWIPTNPPSSIPSGTAGQIVRYNSPTSVTGESNLFWDATNSRFGIGTTSPTRRLTVQDPANAYLQVRGENNGGIELYVSNTAPNAAWDSYASRGNLTTPTATNAGNTLGQFRFFGHTGSAYRQAANISIVNTVNSSGANGVPTDMVFGVTRTGFAGATNRLWLKNRGYFSVGTDTPSGYLTVKSDDSGVPNVRLISSANDSTGIYVRSTTPEAAQAAPPGSLSVLTDGSLFLKLSGTSNTGWGEIFNIKKSYSATTGQIPKWNGSTWVPANDSIGGGGTPGGSNTQIQYNNSGVFGGSSNFTWNNASSLVNIGGGLPGTVLNATTNSSGFGHLMQFSGSNRFQFAYQENVSQFFIRGTNTIGNFGLNPGILINRGANSNVGINVAIGTSPSQPLQVNGNVRIDGAIMPGNSAGTSGQVLTSSGAGVAPVWTTTTLKATATLDFPSTGAHTNSDLTVTVTGAAVGDAVSVAPGLAAISDHSCYTAWVSATNTVTVRFNHYGTSGSTDPASASFNVIVHKF